MISGIWIPPVTPFLSGHVDLDALRTLADSYVAQGASGIVAVGTTAEAAFANGQRARRRAEDSH